MRGKANEIITKKRQRELRTKGRKKIQKSKETMEKERNHRTKKTPMNKEKE